MHYTVLIACLACLQSNTQSTVWKSDRCYTVPFHPLTHCNQALLTSKPWVLQR